MDYAFYKKVEEIKNRFYEIYGEELYNNFDLPQEVYTNFYEINDLLIGVLDAIEQEGWDSIEK